MIRKFTGWHMATVLIAFFGTVMAVNFIMARYATRTFGGLVVENSYVASENFNEWLAEAEAQRALGWDAIPVRRPDGRIALVVSGAPASAVPDAIARHPLGRQPDMALTFERQPNGRFVSREALPEGRWIVRTRLISGENRWAREDHLE